MNLSSCEQQQESLAQQDRSSGHRWDGYMADRPDCQDEHDDSTLKVQCNIDYGVIFANIVFMSLSLCILQFNFLASTLLMICPSSATSTIACVPWMVATLSLAGNHLHPLCVSCMSGLMVFLDQILENPFWCDLLGWMSLTEHVQQNTKYSGKPFP